MGIGLWSAGRRLGVVFLGLSLALLLCALGQSEGPPPPNPEEVQQSYQKYLDLGLSSFIDGQYEKAAEFFHQAIKINPKDETAVKALKSVEKKLSKQASTTYESIDRKVEKVKKYYKQEQYLVAALLLKSITRESPDHPDAVKMVQKISDKLTEHSKTQEKTSYHWFADQGLLAYIEDRYEACFDSWSKAVRLNPDSQLVALAMEEVKSYLDPALIARLSEVKEEPASVPVLSSTVVMQSPSTPLPVFMVEETKEDISVPSPDLSAKEEKIEPEIVLAPVETVPVLQKKPEFRPEQEFPEVVRARSLLSQKKYQSAIQLLNQFLQLKPGHSKAEELLNRALAEQKQAVLQHYNQGLLAYASGDVSKAFVLWQQALKLDPNHSNTKKILLRAFFRPR